MQEIGPCLITLYLSYFTSRGLECELKNLDYSIKYALKLAAYHISTLYLDKIHFKSLSHFLFKAKV